ncbi:MAG: rod-binding protein [Methyloligellaceae bacterium]
MDTSLIQTPAAALSAQSSALIANSGIAANGEAGKAAARKAAEDFEAVFLTTMLQSMFTGLKADPPFGGGHSEEVYRSVLIGEYASEMSRSGGVGIADHVYREILAAQEGQQK